MDSNRISLNTFLEPKKRVFAHLIFWVAYLILFSLLYGSFYEGYGRGFVEVINTLPVKIIATYVTLYWLIPRFLDRKNYLVFGLIFAVSGIAFGYLERWLLHLWFVPNYFPDYNYEAFPLYHIGKAAKNMVNVYSVVFAATAIKLLKRNYQNEKIAEELQKQKLDAELNFLKSQIHPHFLFNTLNNLYALTLTNSPKSAEVVLKLSNLLDYMLYECNADQVLISKEIRQIENYISLERLRYDERLQISLNVAGDLAGISIPPLIILPFVENAFKHGITRQIEDTFISIDLSVKNGRLNLRVENAKSFDYAGIDRGIGLKNVKRRLDLLYGNRAKLQLFDEEETFMIVLKIELKGAS
jgi:two-component system, LytTR family, sensor kinase